MKKILALIFLISSSVLSQYTLSVQDTSALPTTVLTYGRMVKVSGVTYFYESGWNVVTTLYKKVGASTIQGDSIVVTASATATVDSFIYASKSFVGNEYLRKGMAIASGDSAIMPGYATRTMLSTKQATISNLADTSKYLESVTLANITATGTPSSSTYLRGDWTWNTPAGGGTWTELTRTGADTTMSAINTGIRVIGGLEFPMLANKAYAVEFWIVHGGVAATTSGMVLGFMAPTGAVAALTALLPTAADGVAGGWQGWLNGAKDSTVSTATPVVSVWFTSHIYGVIYNGANAGTFSVAWRPEAAANTTVRQNSFGKYKQLN